MTTDILVPDFNDPELNGKFLGTITHDFAQASDVLKEAAYQLKARKISDFPIFPVCKTLQPIGAILIDRFTIGHEHLQWNFYFSFLEEFIQRGIIDADAVEQFKKAYKDQDEYCCLFVVDPELTNYIFIPYPID